MLVCNRRSKCHCVTVCMRPVKMEFIRLSGRRKYQRNGIECCWHEVSRMINEAKVIQWSIQLVWLIWWRREATDDPLTSDYRVVKMDHISLHATPVHRVSSVDKWLATALRLSLRTNNANTGAGVRLNTADHYRSPNPNPSPYPNPNPNLNPNPNPNPNPKLNPFICGDLRCSGRSSTGDLVSK